MVLDIEVLLPGCGSFTRKSLEGWMAKDVQELTRGGEGLFKDLPHLLVHIWTEEWLCSV